MTKRLQIYKCEKCGNVIEVLLSGSGTLECCKTKMVLMEEQAADQTKEKHVPVIEKVEHGTLVKVGSTEHPMTDKHYIQFIEVQVDGGTIRRYLTPDDKPEATFPVEAERIEKAREYCNLHGLWKFEK